MKKFVKTLSRVYFARHIERVRGEVKGLDKAYSLIAESYPDNPFIQAFCEGGQVVVQAYKRAIRQQGYESNLDSIKDLFMIGYRAQTGQIKDFHIEMPEIHIPVFTLTDTGVKLN